MGESHSTRNDRIAELIHDHAQAEPPGAAEACRRPCIHVNGDHNIIAGGDVIVMSIPTTEKKPDIK